MLKRKIIIFILSTVFILTCLCSTMYCWFTMNDTVKSEFDGSIIDKDSSLAVCDYSFYKFSSAPTNKNNSEIMLRPYDYQISSNNLINNTYGVIEVELEEEVDNLSIEISTETIHDAFEVEYFPAFYLFENDIQLIPNGVEPYITYLKFGINNVLYYFNGISYLKCSDATLLTHDTLYWYYSGYKCYYYSYFLSDVVDIEFTLLDITQIDELSSKSTSENLSDFTDFYHVLSNYFSLNSSSIAKDSFLNTTTLDKKNEIDFSKPIESTNVNTINGDSYIYLAINIKYSDIFEKYDFDRNIDQLFYSDFKIRLV